MGTEVNYVPQPLENHHMAKERLRQQDTYDPQRNSDDATTPGGGETLTRQEYKDDADINNIVRRFGIDSHAARQPLFGEMNFDMNLQSAFADIAHANALFKSLPKELRDKYPTRGAMMEAMDNGNFERDLTAALQKRNAPNLNQELTWLREQLTALKSSTSEATTSPAAAAAAGAETPGTKSPPASRPTATNTTRS